MHNLHSIFMCMCRRRRLNISMGVQLPLPFSPVPSYLPPFPLPSSFPSLSSFLPLLLATAKCSGGVCNLPSRSGRALLQLGAFWAEKKCFWWEKFSAVHEKNRLLLKPKCCDGKKIAKQPDLYGCLASTQFFPWVLKSRSTHSVGTYACMMLTASVRHVWLCVMLHINHILAARAAVRIHLICFLAECYKRQLDVVIWFIRCTSLGF